MVQSREAASSFEGLKSPAWSCPSHPVGSNPKCRWPGLATPVAALSGYESDTGHRIQNGYCLCSPRSYSYALNLSSHFCPASRKEGRRSGGGEFKKNGTWHGESYLPSVPITSPMVCSFPTHACFSHSPTSTQTITQTFTQPATVLLCFGEPHPRGRWPALGKQNFSM